MLPVLSLISILLKWRYCSISRMFTVNDQIYAYREGMTLFEGLMEASVDINGPVLISLNGSFVSSEVYRETMLHEGDEIRAMRIVSGG